MKISHEIILSTPLSAIWGVLTDFSRYPEWNPVVVAVDDPVEADAAVGMALKLSGSPPRRIEAVITGLTPPKYFSFETRHRWGEWFLREEWVFRLKERQEGATFVAEAYVTGLGLRFRRARVEDAFRRSLANLAFSLKERLSGLASP